MFLSIHLFTSVTKRRITTKTRGEEPIKLNKFKRQIKYKRWKLFVMPTCNSNSFSNFQDNDEREQEKTRDLISVLRFSVAWINYRNHLRRGNWRCGGHSCRWTCCWKRVVSADTELQWQGSSQWTRCTQITPPSHEPRSCIWTIPDSLLCQLSSLATKGEGTTKLGLVVVLLPKLAISTSRPRLVYSFYFFYLCYEERISPFFGY